MILETQKAGPTAGSSGISVIACPDRSTFVDPLGDRVVDQGVHSAIGAVGVKDLGVRISWGMAPALSS